LIGKEGGKEVGAQNRQMARAREKEKEWERDGRGERKNAWE